MTKHEKLFFAVWSVIFFPLLILYLVMFHGLDKSLVGTFLTFMVSISGVYLGARAFENWNNSPDTEGPAQLDNEGH